MSRVEKPYQHNRNKSHLQSHQLPLWSGLHQLPPGLMMPQPGKMEAAYTNKKGKRNSLQGQRPYYPPPGLNYPSPSHFGMDDIAMAKKLMYVKKYPDPAEKLSSCSTGSSEEDNNYNRIRAKKERSFVVYYDGMPVYDGAPTEDDAKMLICSFIPNPEDRFCCSELKNGPKDVDTLAVPSFL